MGLFSSAKSWTEKATKEAWEKQKRDWDAPKAKQQKKQELKGAGWNGEQARLIADSEFALIPGEKILDITTGKVDGTWTTLAVTDQRVFLHSKRYGGNSVVDFAYGLLTSCAYETGAGRREGKITLVAAGDAATVTDLHKDETNRLGPVIRNHMAMAHSSGPQMNAGPPAAQAPTVTEDPADQLRKLTQLRDDDLITEEEFQAKRTDIMNRL
jgi:hypothetical protein